MKVSDETMLYRKVDDEPMTAEEVLTRVYKSIQEKGYSPINQILGRSEERRVGKECRSRWSPYH